MAVRKKSTALAAAGMPLGLGMQFPARKILLEFKPLEAHPEV